MDRAALLGQLITVFLAELEEHVNAQNRDLLALEAPELSAAERQVLLRNLLRSAHSLKGASRAIGAASIERLCHGLEELLMEISDGRRVIDKELFALFFACVDALDDAGKRLRGGLDFAGSPADAASAWIATVQHGPRVDEGQDKPPSTLAPATVVAVSSAPVISPLEVSLREHATAGPASMEASILRRGSRATDATHVRVAVRKLDTLLTQAGELTVARARMERSLDDVVSIVDLVSRFRVEWQRLERPLKLLCAEDAGGAASGSLKVVSRSFGDAKEIAIKLDEEVGRLATSLRSATHAYRAVALALDAEVKNVRMLPFAEACQGLGRIVRDLAQDRGKEIELVVHGGDVELDRGVLEGLKDPLVHLVRNAVDHGIESPAVRRSAGKPEKGRVEIAATLRGAEVEVTVTDDGRGLDVAAIAERARDKGFAAVDSTAAAARLIFFHGFSTSRSLSVVSGRGVGLDVVKTSVESLHGQVDVAAVEPYGLRFSLTVPLTITTICAVLVEASGQLFAFASTNVERLVRIGDGDLKWIKGRPVLFLGQAAFDVVSLAELLGLPIPPLGRDAKGANVVVISGRGHGVALLVDGLLGVDEILVKNLGRRLRRVRFVSGATVLSSGRLALILSAGELLGEASRRNATRGLSSAIPREPTTKPRKRRILVVDDSVTTRSLNKSVLEAAGFEVLAAVDGQDALRIVEEKGVDLVKSDVEMPQMDGLALTAALRASSKFARLPVVLMTGLGSERDKARGLEVGADAYLVMSAFDKDLLLETVMQLL